LCSWHCPRNYKYIHSLFDYQRNSFVMSYLTKIDEYADESSMWITEDEEEFDMVNCFRAINYM